MIDTTTWVRPQAIAALDDGTSTLVQVIAGAPLIGTVSWSRVRRRRSALENGGTLRAQIDARMSSSDGPLVMVAREGSGRQPRLGSRPTLQTGGIAQGHADRPRDAGCGGVARRGQLTFFSAVGGARVASRSRITRWSAAPRAAP